MITYIISAILTFLIVLWFVRQVYLMPPGYYEVNPKKIKLNILIILGIIGLSFIPVFNIILVLFLIGWTIYLIIQYDIEDIIPKYKSIWFLRLLEKLWIFLTKSL